MKVTLQQKKKNFTMVSNIIAKDNTISLKAKGMCLILVHFPQDWHFYEEKLQDYTSDGKTAISNALKELEVSGYLFRKQLREKGRFSNKLWIFSDEKLSSEDLKDFNEKKKTNIGKTDSGKPLTTNTHSNYWLTIKPTAEKQQLLILTLIISKRVIKKILKKREEKKPIMSLSIF